MNETMSEDALIQCVNAMLDDFSHESTPLVRKIAAGTATREQITRLGIYFAYFTRVTPNELGHLISRCYDAAVRRDLVHILIDEDTGLRCGDQAHYELAMEFVTRFSGMTAEQVAGYPIPYEIQDMNHFRLRLSKEESIGVARACLGIAGETGFSRACAAIAQGLREHYGVKDADQQSWIVHIEGDEGHGAAAEAAARKLVRVAEDQQRCIRLAAEYLDRWQIFYGMAEDPGFKLPRSALRHYPGTSKLERPGNSAPARNRTRTTSRGT
jgi:pyrroloquinoline quinone (PQQ) biosynthesis protein C